MKYIAGLLLFVMIAATGCGIIGGDKLNEDQFVDIMAHQQFYFQYYMRRFGDRDMAREEYELSMDRLLDRYGVTMDDVEKHADNNRAILRSHEFQEEVAKRMQELERQAR